MVRIDKVGTIETTAVTRNADLMSPQSINLGNHKTMVGGDFQGSRMGGGNQAFCVCSTSNISNNSDYGIIWSEVTENFKEVRMSPHMQYLVLVGSYLLLPSSILSDAS